MQSAEVSRLTCQATSASSGRCSSSSSSSKTCHELWMFQGV
jgi:hypothetical protein